MTSVYCCGFLFTYSKRHVLLIKKNRPAWQFDLLNGIGGGLNTNESSGEAMRREFLEEIGLDVLDWRLFCSEVGPQASYVVDFFVSGLPEGSRWIAPVRNDVGEYVMWYDVANIANQNSRMVGNLRWLVPLAMDWRDKDPVLVQTREDIKEKPRW